MTLPPDVRAELVWVRDDFARLVGSAAPEELRAPTDGTRWTNRELLFHLWFGQRITRVMLPISGAFSRLPPSASRRWARLLTAVTGPYEWVNWAGSAAGGRTVTPQRVVGWMRHDTDRILAWADRATDADLSRGMSVPPGWDPYFAPWMSRLDVLRWAPQHYRHHRAQLTTTLPAG